MEELKLTRDEDNNFVVDIVSLMYLVYNGYVKVGAPVYMIEKDGQSTEYFLGQEYLSQFEKNYSLFITEDKGQRSYIEMDAYTMSAKYLIMDEDVTFDEGTPNSVYYEKIHYEEALTRMKKGQDVYLKTDAETFIRKTQKDELNAEMVMDGQWFRREKADIEKFIADNPQFQPVAEKEPEPKRRTKVKTPRTNIDETLRKYLKMTESEFDTMQAQLFAEEYLDADIHGIVENGEDIIEDLDETVCRDILHTLYEEGVIEFVGSGDDIQIAFDSDVLDNFEDMDWDDFI